MVDRHITFGNRDITAQPRFGGKQVVVRGVQTRIGGPEADTKQSPPAVVEEAEVHRCGDRFHAHSQCTQGQNEGAVIPGILFAKTSVGNFLAGLRAHP